MLAQLSAFWRRSVRTVTEARGKSITARNRLNATRFAYIPERHPDQFGPDFLLLNGIFKKPAGFPAGVESKL